MGVLVYQTGGKVIIRRENQAAALGAIKRLIGHETNRLGGQPHFSFVRTSAFLEVTTLEDALGAWRWDIPHYGRDASGNITNIEFSGEKAGDDDYLFASIAPFAEAGSFLETMNENGLHWRWHFGGSHVYKIQGRLT